MGAAKAGDAIKIGMETKLSKQEFLRKTERWIAPRRKDVGSMQENERRLT